MPGLTRRGFTLVEVVLALVLLGVAALVGAEASVQFASLVNEGWRATRVAALGGGRLEILRSQGCGRAEPGQASLAGDRVSWSISETPGGLTVAVTVRPSGDARVERLETTWMCGP